MVRWLVTRGAAMGACLAAVAACGAGKHDVVGPRDVPDQSGAPRIDRVTDLGDLGPIPPRGPLPAFDSDGAFVVGELILIEGRNFGKQPAVSVGDQPVVILGRTGNGGILARIPPAVATGPNPVEVSHPRGRHALPIEVIRHALVVQPGAGVVHVIGLDASGGASVRGTLDIPGARDVAYAHDGQVAYVVADGDPASLTVVATTAGGGPVVLRRHPLPGARAHLVATAPRAAIGAVIGDAGLILLDLGVPRTPALSAPVALPGEVRAAAFEPLGRVLALLSREGNQLTAVDLAPAAPRIAAPLSLLPAERVPRVRDLGFAPDGGEIWVVAGDGPDSLVAGSRPTQLLVVGVAGPSFTLRRAVDVAAAGAPLAVAIGRRESLPSAAAIRSTRRRAPIVIAAASRALVQPDFDLAEVSGAGDLGQLLSADLDGNADLLASWAAVFSAADISHDLALVMTAATRIAPGPGGALEFGLTLGPAAGGEPSFIRLAEASREALLAPAAVALAP